MSEWVPGSMSVVHRLLMRSRNCSGARRIVFLIKYSIKRGRTVCVYLLWLHDVMRLNLQLNSRHAALFHSCPSIGFTCFLRWSNNSLGSACRRLSHLDGSRLCNRGGGRWGGRAWSNVSSQMFLSSCALKHIWVESDLWGCCQKAPVWIRNHLFLLLKLSWYFDLVIVSLPAPHTCPVTLPATIHHLRCSRRSGRTSFLRWILWNHNHETQIFPFCRSKPAQIRATSLHLMCVHVFMWTSHGNMFFWVTGFIYINKENLNGKQPSLVSVWVHSPSFPWNIFWLPKESLAEQASWETTTFWVKCLFSHRVN